MRARDFDHDVTESIDPYRLERLDPQTRRALMRMANHADPGSWLSASEAYAMQLGLQYKNRDPQGWEQGVQHLVDTYRQYSTVREGKVVKGYFNQQQRDQAQWEQDRDQYLQQEDRLHLILKRLAAFWYNNDEDPAVERRLAQMGWEIGQDEGYEDEPGVFVVQQGDEHGRTYRSFSAQELQQLSEGWRDTVAGLALGGLAMAAGAHTVKQGDTVYSIARANNTTPEVIARANGLDRNFTITPGQKLRIPGERDVLDAQRRAELARLGYTDRAVPARSAPADKPKPTPAAGTQTKPASSGASQPRITEPEKSRAAHPPARAKDLPLPNAGPDERRMLKTAMRAGITRVTELAALLAQAAHESQDFTSMRENLYYSAPNLMKTFPTAFSSARIASQYANRPQAIANRAYANRLGNGNEASGDGWRYRGRGYIQLTGRDNYRQAGRALGLPLERNPELASKPDVAAEIAAWYWKQRVRPLVRDFYDVASVTRGINPALRGLRDREQKFIDYYQIMHNREVRI